MTDPTFDPLSYIRNAPVVSVESGIQLARVLVDAAPKGLPAHTKRALARLRRAAEEAQAALMQRQREQVASSGGSNRDIDLAADQAWTVLHDLLSVLSRLPDSYPRAAQARALLATLFPVGTGFLRLAYNEQLSQMEVLLGRIDQEGLARTIDAVLGPEPLQEVRAVLPRYVAMVRARLTEAPPAANLLAHTRALQRAIIEYATVIAATVDSDDAETLTAAQQALRPLDNFRDLQAPGRSPGEPDPAPAPADPGRPGEPASPVPAPAPGADPAPIPPLPPPIDPR
jgi:hypothetical protein